MVVYRDDEKKKLMQSCDKDFTAIYKNNDYDDTINNDNSNIEFVDEQTLEFLNAAEKEILEKKTQENVVENDDDIIDIDEI